MQRSRKKKNDETATGAPQGMVEPKNLARRFHLSDCYRRASGVVAGTALSARVTACWSSSRLYPSRA